MRRGALSMSVACALALVACGGGGGGGGSPSVREEVRAEAERVLRTSDADLFCNRLVTERFLDEIYLGDREVCTEAPANQEEGDGTSTSQITAIEVRGERATVGQRSKTDEASDVSFEYAREGGRWKLDRLNDDYIDRVFELGLEVAQEGSATAVPEMRECLNARAAEGDDPLVRKFVYQAFRGDPKGRSSGIKLAESCPDALSLYVASEFTKGVSVQGRDKEALLGCVRLQLRKNLSRLNLAARALQGDRFGGAGAAALSGVAQGTVVGCRRALADRGRGR